MSSPEPISQPFKGTPLRRYLESLSTLSLLLQTKLFASSLAAPSRKRNAHNTSKEVKDAGQRPSATLLARTLCFISSDLSSRQQSPIYINELSKIYYRQIYQSSDEHDELFKPQPTGWKTACSANDGSCDLYVSDILAQPCRRHQWTH